MEIVQHHLVMPHELNHVGTMFGGIACGLADMSGFLCASLCFPAAAFVTRHFEPFNFTAPAELGDILAIHCALGKIGTSSVSIKIKAFNKRNKKLVFSTTAIFVNVKDGVKSPLKSHV